MIKQFLVLFMLVPAVAHAADNTSTAKTLQERCQQHSTTEKEFKYFEGVLTKGYIFSEPQGLPDPRLCADKPCASESIAASYALNLENSSNQTLSVPVYADIKTLERYAFKLGQKYAVCYTKNLAASKANQRDIWQVDNLGLVEHISIN